MNSIPDAQPALDPSTPTLSRAQQLAALDLLVELNLARGLDRYQVAACGTLRRALGHSTTIVAQLPDDATLLRVLHSTVDELRVHVGLDGRQIALDGDLRRLLGVPTAIRSSIQTDGTVAQVRAWNPTRAGFLR